VARNHNIFDRRGNMQRLLLKVSLFGLISIFSLFSLQTASAAGRYPTRTIEFWFGFTPGGAIEHQTRLLANKLEKLLGVHVIPVAKPGGGGVVATNLLINAAADGYTIANLSYNAIAQTILLSKGNVSLESIRVVSQYSVFNEVLAVAADAPWKTFADFIDYARKNPGVNFAHGGIGTSAYLRMYNVNKNANLKMVAVPFKGDPELTTAILGKHVPIGILSSMSGKAQADAGKMRILFSFGPPAMFGLDPNIPHVHTVFDKSVADNDIPTVGYVALPKKTPDEIVKILENAVGTAARDPEIIAGMAKFNSGVDFQDSKTATATLSSIMDRMKRLQP
jgi:tripartite-type tricarboxylate transporter receptor subunit TctC